MKYESMNLSQVSEAGCLQSAGRQPRWLNCICLPLMTILFCLQASAESGASEGVQAAPRCIVIELYYHERDEAYESALAALQQIRTQRGGINVVLRSLADKSNQVRIEKILRHYGGPGDATLVIYGCNGIICDATPDRTWISQLNSLLQAEVFVRTGCSRCNAAKRWLPEFIREYPGLEFVYRDIGTDSRNAVRLSRLVEQHHTAAASVPVFSLCNRLLVGFDTAETTGPRLRGLLQQWTQACRTQNIEQPGRAAPAESRSPRAGTLTPANSAPAVADKDAREQELSLNLLEASLHNAFAITIPFSDLPLPDSVGSDRTSDETPVPLAEEGADDGLSLPEPEALESSSGPADDHIDLPVFGKLSVSKLGMPLLTIVTGLVDGFNPCAMWVLLFLLAILVNLQDRRRILAIAGTFVVVSGIAYFAFMAAWLNLFMLIGYLRPIQAGLAILAIVIGSVHIKDFFAFKKGFSLSIPESARPGIYARVRRIVTAEHLAGAIAGATTLAVLVNIVELLCTAGLPALYTNILMQQGYSSAERYAFLGLYVAAYMFDDSLMVGIVTMTLSRRKLQEAQGRWLKLISGTAILLLGLVMLLRPEWLH